MARADRQTDRHVEDGKRRNRKPNKQADKLKDKEAKGGKLAVIDGVPSER